MYLIISRRRQRPTCFVFKSTKPNLIWRKISR